MADFNIRQFKVGGQDYKIAQRLLDGKSREEVIREFFPMVGKRPPFIFKENIGGGRRKKPLDDQYRLFLYQVNRTIGKMVQAGWENPENKTDEMKWSSKERHWVRWRQNYINDLVKEGVIDDPDGIKPPKPRPDIPAPGEVTPVDTEGNPIGGENGVDLTPEQYTELWAKLDIEGKIATVSYDDVGMANEWLEFDEEIAENEDVDDDDAVAKWHLDSEHNHVREPKLSKREAKRIIEEVDNLEKEVYKEKKKTRADLIDEFYQQMMIARDFVVTRELGGEYLDIISTRAIKDGAKAIAYGLHPDEIMQAVMKTWSQDSKREFERHERPWKPKPTTIDVSRYPVPFDGAHEYLGYVMVLAKARIPVFLVGPSGCGKSFMARDLSEALEADYGELPLTAGATPSWLVGAETITGYKSRPFVEIYENGGVFCFEEMDAADPNMLLLVNNALANESFANPVTGEEIEKSKDFIPIATANTWGLGANRQYTGRERLDAATLDRWRVGRVELDYDQNIEKIIIKQMKKIAEKRSGKKPKKARV